MLRHFANARLALQHSPLAEQRLVFRRLPGGVGGVNTGANGSENTPEGGQSESGTERAVSKHVSKIQGETRQRLAFLNDLAQLQLNEERDNTVLTTFFSDHQEFLDRYFRNELQREFTPENATETGLEWLMSRFAAEMDEMTKRSIENLGPKFSFSLTQKNFTANFIRSSRNLPATAEVSDDEIAEAERTQYIPSAYLHDGTIHLNVDHPDLNYEKQLAILREERPNITEEQVLEIVEKNRQRAVVHEMAHYVLDRKDRDEGRLPRLRDHMKNALGVKTLRDHQDWKALMAAVDEAFDGKFDGKRDEEYLHEAVAISAAAKRFPLEKDSRERAVVAAYDKLTAAVSGDAAARGILSEFEADLAKQVDGDGTMEAPFQFAMRKMDTATAERSDNLKFKELYDREDAGVLTKNPEQKAAKQKAMDDLGDEEIPEGGGGGNSDKAMAKIKAIRDAMSKMRNMKADYIKGLSGHEQHDQAHAFDVLMGRFEADMDALASVEADVTAFGQWEIPNRLSPADKNGIAEKYGFADLGAYDSGMNQAAVIDLDAKNKKKRGEAVDAMTEMIGAHFKPLVTTAEKIEGQILELKDAQLRGGGGEGNMSVFDFFRQHLGKQSGALWLNPLDFIKIYNIYKDAIQEWFSSRQKIRTYDAARSWNVWPAIQPDLDKSAKSANDEETEKFKEYLKKDGFTYDQLFKPGGVLDVNRTNINRAKAVIDYAADHAWLYHLDRHNGHDVYGIDYEGLFGIRTFEELVEHNADTQEKESKAGYSKVNNHPEIPMIVDDMIAELKRKNIWQVHGMMKRLQEKAKLAESNTWALTTLYRAMREDPEILEIMDIGMLDKIGNIGIGQSAWALTLYKVQRKQILAMKEKVKQFGSKAQKIAAAHTFSDTRKDFVMGRAIKKIEEMLPDRLKHKTLPSGEPDYRELDHEVAKVLASQTVYDKDGNPLSIFDSSIPEFKAYRDFYFEITDTTPTEPKKTDPDFFNPANDGSDVLLLGQNEVGNILGHQSQGPWIEENKGVNFLTQVFMRDEELGALDPSGALQKSYRADMKRKFTLYLNSKVLAQAAAMNYLAKVRTTTNPSVVDGVNPKSIANKLVLLEMKKRGYIDLDVFKKIRNTGGKDLDKKSIEEYDADDPPFPPPAPPADGKAK